MKSTGIVRRIDALGRFVVPIELRNILELETNDSVEIFTEGDKVILRKYRPACLFCGQADNVEYYKGKLICKDCLEELKKL